VALPRTSTSLELSSRTLSPPLWRSPPRLFRSLTGAGGWAQNFSVGTRTAGPLTQDPFRARRGERRWAPVRAEPSRRRVKVVSLVTPTLTHRLPPITYPFFPITLSPCSTAVKPDASPSASMYWHVQQSKRTSSYFVLWSEIQRNSSIKCDVVVLRTIRSLCTERRLSP
jgi:hypothetical protein